MTSIKIQYKREFHRYSSDCDNLADFMKEIRSILDHQSPSNEDTSSSSSAETVDHKTDGLPAQLLLKYRDSDGDRVTVSSDEEFAAMLAHFKAEMQPPLRIYVEDATLPEAYLNWEYKKEKFVRNFGKHINDLWDKVSDLSEDAKKQIEDKELTKDVQEAMNSFEGKLKVVYSDLKSNIATVKGKAVEHGKEAKKKSEKAFSAAKTKGKVILDVAKAKTDDIYQQAKVKTEQVFQKAKERYEDPEHKFVKDTVEKTKQKSAEVYGKVKQIVRKVSKEGKEQVEIYKEQVDSLLGEAAEAISENVKKTKKEIPKKPETTKEVLLDTLLEEAESSNSDSEAKPETTETILCAQESSAKKDTKSVELGESWCVVKKEYHAKLLKASSDALNIPVNSLYTKTWAVLNAPEETDEESDSQSSSESNAKQKIHTWPSNTVLSHVGGDFVGIQTQAVPCVQSYQEYTISIDIVAPKHPGQYNSVFRLRTADGCEFGDALTCSFTCTQQEEQEESEDSSENREENKEKNKEENQPIPVVDDEQLRMYLNTDKLYLKYVSQMQQLKEMGFIMDDIKALQNMTKLLKKYKGSIEKVVNHVF